MADAVVDCASLTSAVGPDGPAGTPPPCDAPWAGLAATTATTSESEPVSDNPDVRLPPAVEQYFAENPDILAVELTDYNTTGRRPR